MWCVCVYIYSIYSRKRAARKFLQIDFEQSIIKMFFFPRLSGVFIFVFFSIPTLLFTPVKLEAFKKINSLLSNLWKKEKDKKQTNQPKIEKRRGKKIERSFFPPFIIFYFFKSSERIFPSVRTTLVRSNDVRRVNRPRIVLRMCVFTKSSITKEDNRWEYIHTCIYIYNNKYQLYID